NEERLFIFDSGIDLYGSLSVYSGDILVDGKPVDSIVSQGSNSRGSWIRYANGIQMCWHETSVSAPNNSSGSVYRSPTSNDWTYPQPFSEDPSVSCSSSGGTVWVDSTGVGDTTRIPFRAFSSTQSSSDPIVRAFAIGRWR